MDMKNEEILRAMVGRNADHYLWKFAQIEQGQKTTFQWSAFFLGWAFILYRRCNELIKKYYLVPLILSVVVVILPRLILTLSSGLIYSDFDLYMSIAGVLIGIISIIDKVVGIWLFVVGIILGKKFPQLYLEHLLALKEKENIVDVEKDRMKINSVGGTNLKTPIIINVVLVVVGILSRSI